MLKKYDLIHLSDRLSKFNMQIFVQLREIIKSSDTEIRILEIWIDPQLKWKAHVKQILDKMKTQINALYRITVSTWRVIFVRACQIYSVMIRSALIYEAAVWHILSSIEKEVWQIRSLAVKLEKIQNKCLWTVTEVYKAISVMMLKTEVYTHSLKIYLDFKIADFCRYHQNSEMKKVIIKICRKIHWQLNIRQSQTVLTAGEKQIRWTDQWFMPPEDISEISPQQAVQHWWKKRWGCKSYQWGLVKVGTSCCKILKTHKDLRKAESAVLIHIWTDQIDLAAFLNKMQISDFLSFQCRCSQVQKTAAHIILHCLLYAETRERLCASEERLNIKILMSISKNAWYLTWWFIKLCILSQFNLAEELLYEEKEDEERVT